jgi:hypothetical protein
MVGFVPKDFARRTLSLGISEIGKAKPTFLDPGDSERGYVSSLFRCKLHQSLRMERNTRKAIGTFLSRV